MGILTRRTPEERRRQRMLRQRQQPRRNPTPSSPQSQISQTPVKSWGEFSSFKRWNLIPIEQFTNKGLYYSMCFDYPNFAHRYGHFQNFVFWIGKPNLALRDCPYIHSMYIEAKEKYFLNQKLRFQFKRLISVFLQKKMKMKNDKDPITLEAPKEPVYLYDHSNRCKFQFEAKELLRDFSTRLLAHEDLFPTPLFLRNPLTNAKLHLGQILSLYSQIKSHGQMHWTLECFQDAGFSIILFSRDNRRKLRLSALKELMRSQESDEFILEFIESQHDIFNKPFDFRTYQWAFKTKKCHSMERIRSWKTMCYTFYEIEITEEDIFERQRKMAKLTPIVLDLCSPAIEIQQVKRSQCLPKP